MAMRIVPHVNLNRVYLRLIKNIINIPVKADENNEIIVPKSTPPLTIAHKSNEPTVVVKVHISPNLCLSIIVIIKELNAIGIEPGIPNAKTVQLAKIFKNSVGKIIKLPLSTLHSISLSLLRIYRA